MPPPEEPTLEERLKTVEVLLRNLEASVGVGERPDDPAKAWRFERSLLSHFSDMRDQFHQWNNTAHVLLGRLDRVNKTVETSAVISRQNREGIQQVEALTRQIEAYARSISNNLGLVTREKPLLMRDLFWLETNTVEVGLILYSFGEAMVLLRGSEALVRTPTYRGLAGLFDSPVVWGSLLGLVAAGSIIAFACRRRKWRMGAMFGQALYFLTTGVMTLITSPSVLGWWPHMLAGLGALWVLSRGPSDAPK